MKKISIIFLAMLLVVSMFLMCSPGKETGGDNTGGDNTGGDNTGENKVAKPVISPAKGSTLTKDKSITFACATEGATIYYSFDGSDPSIEYNGSSIEAYYATDHGVDGKVTIKAIAKKNGMSDSDVSSSDYIVPPIPNGPKNVRVSDSTIPGTGIICEWESPDVDSYHEAPTSYIIFYYRDDDKKFRKEVTVASLSENKVELTEGVESGRSYRVFMLATNDHGYSIAVDAEPFPFTTDSPLTDVEGIEMIKVEGGAYNQTNAEGESFIHTISNFYIGKYEVTYELWYKVYQWAISKNYEFANAGKEGDDGTVGAEPTPAGKYEPVTTINWRDAIVWCNAYSELRGFSPVYKSGGAVLKDSRDSNGDNCDSAEADFFANGYRLPTDGEWQYAASYKDGTNFTPWNYVSGDTVAYDNPSNKCDSFAWYSDNSGNHAHPVGGKGANALGIHDMSGNVWEWCWDWYGNYPSGSHSDYTGPSSGSPRVLRGGGFHIDSGYLRVGFRYAYDPSDEDPHVGFRVALRRP